MTTPNDTDLLELKREAKEALYQEINSHCSPTGMIEYTIDYLASKGRITRAPEAGKLQDVVRKFVSFAESNPRLFKICGKNNDQWMPLVNEAKEAITPIPPEAARGTYPAPLNADQIATCKTWAADDRLWTTQETVEINLTTFARTILNQQQGKS